MHLRIEPEELVEASGALAPVPAADGMAVTVPFAGTAMANVDPVEVARGLYADVVKPLTDRLLALLALLLLLPVLLAVALAVRVSLGRGILYRQERVGLGGTRFEVLKFRTMHPDRRCSRAHHQYRGPDRRRVHKTDQDPRHTPTGRFLRRWSLDELPQLFNVLRGEMSLIGPRPELPSVVERYEGWEHERHNVRPGLTGLWQVEARGDGTLMCEHADLDVRYVRDLGFRTDLRIVARTIPALLGRRPGE